MRLFTFCLIFLVINAAFTPAQKTANYLSPLNFTETVDSINKMLSIHSNYGHYISASIDGRALLATRNDDHFVFNFIYLENSGSSSGYEINGIEMISADEEAQAIHNWIYFNSFKGREAFIKLDDISRSELTSLHRLFIHLHNLCLQRLFMNG